MVYTLRFFSLKCSLFHNPNLFGSCVIHILYTGCAKIKKKNSGAKGLIYTKFQFTSYSAQILRDSHVNICCILLCFTNSNDVSDSPLNNKNEYPRVHRRHVGSLQQLAMTQHRFWLHQYHCKSYQNYNKLPETAGRTQVRQKLSEVRITSHRSKYQSTETSWREGGLTFRRRIKSRLPFAGIIRSSPYSTRFQDKG